VRNTTLILPLRAPPEAAADRTAQSRRPVRPPARVTPVPIGGSSEQAPSKYPGPVCCATDQADFFALILGRSSRTRLRPGFVSVIAFLSEVSSHFVRQAVTLNEFSRLPGRRHPHSM
jgi:hypothetical protein